MCDPLDTLVNPFLPPHTVNRHDCRYRWAGADRVGNEVTGIIPRIKNRHAGDESVAILYELLFVVGVKFARTATRYRLIVKIHSRDGQFQRRKRTLGKHRADLGPCNQAVRSRSFGSIL